MIDARTLADIRTYVEIQATLARIQGILTAILKVPAIDGEDNRGT